MKSALHTTDPVALRYLMSETLFSIDEAHAEATESIAAAEEQPAQASPSPVFDFLGGNQKGYLFITADPQSDYMSAAGMDAFTKTLGARQLGLPDVAVFNRAKHTGQVAFADLASFFKPRAVILLGSLAETLGMDAIPSNAIAKVGGIPVFQTFSFDVLLVDAAKKSEFWPVLKSVLV